MALKDSYPIYFKDASSTPVRKTLGADFGIVASGVVKDKSAKKTLPSTDFVENSGKNIYVPTDYVPAFESYNITINGHYKGNKDSWPAIKSLLQSYLGSGLLSAWFSYKGFGAAGLELSSIQDEVIKSDSTYGDIYSITIIMTCNSPDTIVTKSDITG